MDFSLEKLALDLKNAAEFVSHRVINREEIIQQAFCAFLTGEHLLLQSRTGVGKSLLAEQLFAMFEGASIFRVQASKEQQPDTYFGGLDIEKLKTGKIFHNTEGSLVECDFGFIDEIFDANDFTLRALLSLLNERRMIRGVQNVPANIHSVIAATNYLRISEVTEAILDRFLYKSIILPDKDPLVQFKISTQYSQHSGRVLEPKERIKFSHLKKLQQMISGVDTSFKFAISAEMLYFTNLVIRHYEFSRNRAQRERFKGHSATAFSDFYISPRTQAKSLDLLRALAFMEGRTLATTADVEKLYYIFATVGIPEEVQIFKKSFNTINNAMNSGNGFEQIRILLAYETLLEQIEVDHSILQRPLHTTLSNTPLRLTLLEWLKEKVVGIDQSIHHNKRVLEKFIHELVPVCDEVRELKHALEKESTRIFQQIEN
ncbi:MAG: MoxR family ATPase [Bacteroidetes bacterium]|nr:MoxR family ATPase [Bacteroidota bacterium]